MSVFRSVLVGSDGIDKTTEAGNGCVDLENTGRHRLGWASGSGRTGGRSLAILKILEAHDLPLSV
jgi:hypothetical protein